MKTDPSFHSSHQLPIASQLRVELTDYLHAPRWDFCVVCSCAGLVQISHSCSEFIGALSLLSRGKHYLADVIHHFWLLQSFHPIFPDDLGGCLGEAGVWYRCLI